MLGQALCQMSCVLRLFLPFFETGSNTVAQGSLEFSLQLQLAVNSW